MVFTVLLIGEGISDHAELTGYLKESGFEVKPIAGWSGVSSAIKASEHSPCAAVFDLEHESTGMADLKRFKKKHPDLHLLAVASGSHHPEMADCIEKHLFALLKKPVDPEELVYLLGGISKIRKEPSKEDQK